MLYIPLEQNCWSKIFWLISSKLSKRFRNFILILLRGSIIYPISAYLGNFVPLLVLLLLHLIDDLSHDILNITNLYIFLFLVLFATLKFPHLFPHSSLLDFGLIVG